MNSSGYPWQGARRAQEHSHAPESPKGDFLVETSALGGFDRKEEKGFLTSDAALSEQRVPWALKAMCRGEAAAAEF